MAVRLELRADHVPHPLSKRMVSVGERNDSLVGPRQRLVRVERQDVSALQQGLGKQAAAIRPAVWLTSTAMVTRGGSAAASSSIGCGRRLCDGCTSTKRSTWLLLDKPDRPVDIDQIAAHRERE